jgi:hypothetical protein
VSPSDWGSLRPCPLRLGLPEAVSPSDWGSLRTGLCLPQMGIPGSSLFKAWLSTSLVHVRGGRDSQTPFHPGPVFLDGRQGEPNASQRLKGGAWG